MRNRLIFLLLTISLLAGACAPGASPVPAAASSAAPAARSLTVLAAASLKDSFNELGKLFESRNPGVSVAFNFAGSQQLAQQLEQGAPADVFASASQKYMDAAVKSGRVDGGASAIFARNRLVVIFPKDNPAGLTALHDLARPGLKLDLGDRSVPVGQYSLDFLDKAAQEAAFGADFKDRVLANVVSYETDVKAVVSKVSLGEADAGIVYTTDFAAAADALGRLEIPDALNTVANYPIAAISDSKNAALAKEFIHLLLSAEGQGVLAKYGFEAVR